MHVSLNSWHAYCTHTRLTGTGDNKGGKKEEVARLVETLALGSVGKSTQKNYLAKWNTWVKERKAQGKGPWLHTLNDPNEALTEVLEFMTSRCFVHNNQQSTVRGYLAAINFFHKMFAGWELPMSHCMIVAVGKGIDRAHGMSQKKKQVRLPLTWAILAQGRQAVVSMEDGGYVMWLGLAVSYFLLCRASELWAYANGQVHPEFCLTRNCLSFFHGEVQVAFEKRSIATAVQVTFLASKCDQKRAGCTITRTRLEKEKETGGASMGAFEALLELLNVYPLLPAEAPLTVRSTPFGWKVFTRTEAVAALRFMVGSSGRDPMQFALHSGRIGGGTQLASQGISELQIQRAGRWKSRAFMTYVREAGEGANSVSAALAKT